VAAITRESAQHFHVRFDELARRGLLGLGKREAVQVDPYLIGRALAEVMDACTVRSAAGRSILWNDYRVIFARVDFDMLAPLRGMLDHDLREVMTREARARDADLVGELRVTLVADEANELARGHAVVRTAFVPTGRFAPPAVGEMTLCFDGGHVVAELEPTLAVAEAGPAPSSRYLLRWRGGTATVGAGDFVVVGRPHPDAPGKFVPLHGASAKISKQHFVLATGTSTVKIGRLPNANPVEVNGHPIAAGADTEATVPVRIALSRDDLIVEISKT
jgi:hypothetical protein